MKEKHFKEFVFPGVTLFVAIGLSTLAIWVVFLPINSGIGSIISLATLVIFSTFSLMRSPKIRVEGNFLKISKAKIEIRFISKAKLINQKDLFTERGVGLNALAYCVFQVGVTRAVRIEIEDSSDPTPYWLVSSRKPNQLIRALDANRAIF